VCGLPITALRITEGPLYFRKLGIPRIVISPRAARELAHNNGCGPLLQKAEHPRPKPRSNQMV
jgi:hypothetical protein